MDAGGQSLTSPADDRRAAVIHVSAQAGAVTRRGRAEVGRRTGAARALGAAACLVLVLALAPEARAGVGASDASDAPGEHCSPGWVCGWTGPAYTGVVSLVATDMPRFPETTAYVGFNDGASVWNGAAARTADGALWGRCVTVYSKPGYKGRSLTVLPGRGIAQLPAAFGHIHSGRFHDCRLP
ncbi:peptidase inhibitor family I36 protein [Streptomyces sp. NBC_01276]|uniref:peptidase inhibitor family I36 protein n=1 Tax=Streptomyces sp. NBC_01276 TaxID=2903808 RepID=UPI00352C0204